MSEFETAVSMPFGGEPAPPARSRAPGSSYELLKRELLPALERPPCLVSFPGDAASSLTLYAAAEAAREHGLELPVPLTASFGAAGGGANDSMRDFVAGLGLPRWEEIDLDGKLDLLGDTARSMLLRHGLLFPAVSHLLVASLEAAGGGSLVDTHGMDNAGRVWRGKALAAALRRRRPRRSDLIALAALAPGPLRRAMGRRAIDRFGPAYLHPAAKAEWLERAVHDITDMPLRYAPAMRIAPDQRCNSTSHATFLTLAADCDVRFVFPFMSPDFVAAVGKEGGALGFGSPAALARFQAPGADFPEPPKPVDYKLAWWSGPSLDFIESWDGTGLNEDIVDPEAVRQAWRDRDMKASLLLQAAWLAAERGAGRAATAAPAQR